MATATSAGARERHAVGVATQLGHCSKCSGSGQPRNWPIQPPFDGSCAAASKPTLWLKCCELLFACLLCYAWVVSSSVESPTWVLDPLPFVIHGCFWPVMQKVRSLVHKASPLGGREPILLGSWPVPSGSGLPASFAGVLFSTPLATSLGPLPGKAGRCPCAAEHLPRRGLCLHGCPRRELFFYPTQTCFPLDVFL